MIAIVAVDENWGIGCDGELLFNIPEDMQFFKKMSDGKVVVMGYATLISLPNSKPLKNRTNIVLTKRDLNIDGVIVCRSIDELLKTAKKYSPDDVIVMGGEQVYAQLLDYCHKIYVTKIKGMKKADRYFPNVDLLDNWKLADISEEKEHNGLKYSFNEYINTKFKILVKNT